MTDMDRLLTQIEQGDPTSADELLLLVYGELRQLAAAKLSHERPGQTLQATALVHEAYLNLVGTGETTSWESRAHFFGAAAEAMRRILVNRAVRKARPKHGGEHRRIDLDEQLAVADAGSPLLEELDESLQRLAAVDPEAAQIVKLKYFAGLPLTQIAELLRIPSRTVDRRWSYARAWLHQDLLRE